MCGLNKNKRAINLLTQANYTYYRQHNYIDYQAICYLLRFIRFNVIFHPFAYFSELTHECAED